MVTAGWRDEQIKLAMTVAEQMKKETGEAF